MFLMTNILYRHVCALGYDYGLAISSPGSSRIHCSMQVDTEHPQLRNVYNIEFITHNLRYFAAAISHNFSVNSVDLIWELF